MKKGLAKATNGCGCEQSGQQKAAWWGDLSAFGKYKEKWNRQKPGQQAILGSPKQKESWGAACSELKREAKTLRINLP